MTAPVPKYRALVTDRFSKEGLEVLREAGLSVHEAPGLSGDALLAEIKNAHALLVRSQTRVDPALLAHAPSLLVVGRAGVGYENIDVAACDAAGVAVLNTPGASAVTTAERTLALLFALLHQICAAERSVRAGKWDRRSFMANELSGKTIGVLGYGNVGRLVASRAKALGMNVLVHGPHTDAQAVAREGFTAATFDALLAQSDVVSCHVRADPALKGLIGRAQLRAMKRGSWLVNTARGYLVDEKALVEALKDGHLKGAALDVFDPEPLPLESELRRFENVVLSPHLGASSAEAEGRMSITVAEEVVRFLSTATAANLLGQPKRYRHHARDAG